MTFPRTTCKRATAAFALAGLLAAPATAFAVTGAGGPDLPAYARALGTLENGPGSTGMTVEEANRIIAQEQRDRYGVAEAPPAPRRHHHRATH